MVSFETGEKRGRQCSFGKDADSMRMILNGCKESGNFLELLDLYSPDGAKSLDKLREQQYKHGGIV